MSGISKRVSGSWVSGDYGIMGTSTDTITTLPAVLYADGTNATVGLVGNMQQTGTPTPQNPIQPSETGERTGNLWNYTFTSGYNLDTTTGIPTTYGSQSRMATLTPIDVSAYDNVAFNFVNTTTYTLYAMYSTMKNGTLVNRVANIQPPFVVDVSNADEIYFCIYNASSTDAISNDSITNVMLNVGSSALPYEPYGYVLPIKSANTTTPVYLGEVQTTRKIKKYEFTGNESWTKVGNVTAFYTSIDEAIDKGIDYIISSHYTPSMSSANGTIRIANSKIELLIYDNYSSATDFKTYLQQQYSAGTPVTVWYVLATETTSIVNEPLRKIGDYADTVSGITIPTTAGENSFDVLTTLKPSEVTANYHGWHTGAVHERDSGQWD